MPDYTTTMVMCTYAHVHKTERRKRKKEKTVIIIKRNADVSGQILFFSFAAAQLLNFFSHPTFSHRSRWSWRERQGKPVGLVFFLVVLSYITRLHHVTRWERERQDYLLRWKNNFGADCAKRKARRRKRFESRLIVICRFFLSIALGSIHPKEGRKRAADQGGKEVEQFRQRESDRKEKIEETNRETNEQSEQ